MQNEDGTSSTVASTSKSEHLQLTGMSHPVAPAQCPETNAGGPTARGDGSAGEAAPQKAQGRPPVPPHRVIPVALKGDVASNTIGRAIEGGEGDTDYAGDDVSLAGLTLTSGDSMEYSVNSGWLPGLSTASLETPAVYQQTTMGPLEETRAVMATSPLVQQHPSERYGSQSDGAGPEGSAGHGDNSSFISSSTMAGSLSLPTIF
ncbi:unnamed protein product, partial [Sphacelaria rigidula]